ncbi:hypothetical protein, partial [Aeromonas hydrophila]|uniref:hypothetical protein n=3 Tax=Aeromonas hydrophila TaxID=644 RepID=UPI00195535EA
VNPYVTGSSPVGGAKFEKPAHRAGFFHFGQLPLQVASSRVAPQVALNSSKPVCSTPSGFTRFSFLRNRIHLGFIKPTSSCYDPCPVGRRAIFVQPPGAVNSLADNKFITLPPPVFPS